MGYGCSLEFQLIQTLLLASRQLTRFCTDQLCIPHIHKHIQPVPAIFQSWTIWSQNLIVVYSSVSPRPQAVCTLGWQVCGSRSQPRTALHRSTSRQVSRILVCWLQLFSSVQFSLTPSQSSSFTPNLPSLSVSESPAFLIDKRQGTRLGKCTSTPLTSGLRVLLPPSTVCTQTSAPPLAPL